MSEENGWEPTMELRFMDRYVGLTLTKLLQQKWVSGKGTANNPFKVEWRNALTYTEER
jgi:hypothetical protein